MSKPLYQSDLGDAEWHLLRPLLPKIKAPWPPCLMEPTLGSERHLLSAAHWLLLADDAA
jgi:transposase